MNHRILFVFFFATFHFALICQTGFAQPVNAYQRYVDGFLKKIDSNMNGVIDRREIKQMRQPIDLDTYDTDDDLQLTRKELIGYAYGRMRRSKETKQRSTPHKRSQTTAPVARNFHVKMDWICLNDAEKTDIATWANDIARSTATLNQLMADLQPKKIDVVELSSVVPLGIENQMSHSIARSNHSAEVNLRFAIEETNPDTIVSVSFNSDHRQPENDQVRINAQKNKSKHNGSFSTALNPSTSKDELERLILQRIEEKRKKLQEQKSGATSELEREKTHFESKIVCNQNGESLSFGKHGGQTWILAIRVNPIRP